MSVRFSRLNELLLFNSCLARVLEDMRNTVGKNEYCFIDSDSGTGSQAVLVGLILLNNKKKS